MTRFEAGDLVRVPFPYVETNARRFRPAVVVTRGPVGPDGLLIWVAMVTNAKRKHWPGDLEVENYRAAGLPIPSVIRTAKLATIEAESAERLGRLSAGQLQTVRKALISHLGLE